MIIHPRAFFQIEDSDREKIIFQSTLFYNKKITVDEFNNEDLERIGTHYRIGFENKRNTARGNLDKVFRENNCQIIKIDKLEPFEVDRLNNVFIYAGKKYEATCLEVGIKFAKKVECTNLVEFTAAFEYIVHSIERSATNTTKFIAICKQYIKEETEKSPNSLFNQTRDSFQKLINQTRTENNRQSQINFANVMAAANHYYKHCCPKKQTSNNLHSISVKEYFSIARNTITQKDNIEKTETVTQNGKHLCLASKNYAKKVTVIQYCNLKYTEKILATCYYDKKLELDSNEEKQNSDSKRSPSGQKKNQNSKKAKN